MTDIPSSRAISSCVTTKKRSDRIVVRVTYSNVASLPAFVKGVLQKYGKKTHANGNEAETTVFLQASVNVTAAEALFNGADPDIASVR